MDRLTTVMATLTRHPEAWQFNEPVNEDFAPYYYTLIEVIWVNFSIMVLNLIIWCIEVIRCLIEVIIGDDSGIN